MIKSVWNVLLIIILVLAAVWLLLFASNRSLAQQQGTANSIETSIES